MKNQFSDINETPDSYQASIRSYLGNIQNTFNIYYKNCLKHDYSSDVAYIDFVYYPELFTQRFAVYVWPTLLNGDLFDSDLEKIFADNINLAIEENLNPYDVDYDWRDRVFGETLSDFFSSSYENINIKVPNIKFYLLTPDSSWSWDICARRRIKSINK